MRVLKYLLALLLATSCYNAANLYAADEHVSRFDEELNERDFDALRDFLKAKKAVDIEENTSNLTISGDVRTEWRHLNETCKGERLRGRNRSRSRNDFDLEFNLYFNYIYDRTWAIVQVRYDNSAGVDDNDHPCKPVNPEEIDNSSCCIDTANECFGDPSGYHGSGHCDDLCLKKAYMGYNVYECGPARFDVELGRRGNLYNVFDSNIQFLSRFDGLVLKYDNSWEYVADWYVHAAGFVVDERVNHFAWISEVGFLNIADSSIDFKYSFIDWEKHGRNRCGVHDPRGFRFLNSQFTLAYHVDPDLFSRPIKLYGAFLVNHAAHKNVQINNHRERQNLGWYAGLLIGEVRKEGDWALEVQYQYVEAFAMPDDDVSGIARGNVLDESITTCSRRGNTNYKGWRFELLYAITDHLTLDTIYEYSNAADRHVGGRHTYSKYEMEAIYAF